MIWLWIAGIVNIGLGYGFSYITKTYEVPYQISLPLAFGVAFLIVMAASILTELEEMNTK